MTDAQTGGCEQPQYFARILLDHLPPWLEDEIRRDRLTILDWGRVEGEAVKTFRTHFPESSIHGTDRSTKNLPVEFDVLITSNVLQELTAPWTVLRRLGAQVGRHLVVLVPYGEGGQSYTFDDAAIGTHIDPDFRLSSFRMIGGEILLVYSRLRYMPANGTVFDQTGSAVAKRYQAEPAVAAPVKAPPEVSSPALEDPIGTILLPALQSARSVTVVGCAIPFSRHLNQRPISCAKCLADEGSTVLFAELWETPEQATHHTGEEVYPGIFSIPFYPFRSEIEHTLQDNIGRIAAATEAPRSYLCTLPSREMVETARALQQAGYHIHYDIMDDWEAFLRGDEEMTHWFSAPLELELVAFADTVSAVSEELARKFARLRPDIEVVRNGYQPSALECEQFAAARTPLERPKVVGYFGHLSDAWFDWETVLYAAGKRPAIEFQLIGYGLSESSRLRITRFPNVRFLGLVPQKELHLHACKWWAGMIPFQPTTLSAAVDPLKVYEYLHFGLPALVTGITGIAGYPLVEYAADRESFVEALDRLPDRPDEQSLAQVAEFLKTCVWEARMTALRSLMSRQSGEAERKAREAALHADRHYWQGKATELGKQLQHLQCLQQTGMATAQVLQAGLAAREAALQTQILAEQAESGRRQARIVELEQQAQSDRQLRERQEEQSRAEAAKWAAAQTSWETEVTSWDAALRQQQEHWQAKSRELARQFAGERARLEESQRHVAALTARLAAAEYEAANLRRLSSDLLRSWSWKMTAPVRWAARPMFTAPPVEPPAAVSAGAVASVPELWQEAIVIPCAVPFRSTFNQRPISMAKYFAERGRTVLYVAWQFTPGEPVGVATEEVYPRIYQLPLAAFQAQVSQMAASPAPGAYVCSLPDPRLVEAARKLRAGGYHIHYDIMDDWEEFHRGGEAAWYSAAGERELLTLANTVTAVSEKLAAKFHGVRNDIAVVRNGYDPMALECPQFVAARAPLGRKVVGYFGHLSDAWFDWEAVQEAARKLPEVEFELIGYGLSDRSRARLGDFPNIRLQGMVAQNDLHRFARKWWAGMIPFRPSALSAAVDPLKVYEYLHFGLPTVVTGVSGISGYPLVKWAGDRAGFIAALRGVDARPDESTLAAAAEFLKSCVWEERLAKLESLIARHAVRAAQ